MKKVGIESLPYTLDHPYKFMHEAVKKLNIDDFGIIDEQEKLKKSSMPHKKKKSLTKSIQ